MEAGPTIKDRSNRFASTAGRRPRMYVTSIDGVGTDRDIQGLAVEFAALGFDVDINTHTQTPRQVARAAVENDVHVIALTGLSAVHRNLLRRLSAAIQKEGGSAILVALWGCNIPEDSRNSGISMVVFPAEMPREQCAAKILDMISNRCR